MKSFTPVSNRWTQRPGPNGAVRPPAQQVAAPQGSTKIPSLLSPHIKHQDQVTLQWTVSSCVHFHPSAPSGSVTEQNLYHVFLYNLHKLIVSCASGKKTTEELFSADIWGTSNLKVNHKWAFTLDSTAFETGSWELSIGVRSRSRATAGGTWENTITALSERGRDYAQKHGAAVAPSGIQ